MKSSAHAGMAASRTIAVAVVEMTVAYGIRLAVTDAESVRCDHRLDPQQFLIYAYDTVAKCFIYANHDLRNGASIVQPGHQEHS